MKGGINMDYIIFIKIFIITLAGLTLYVFLMKGIIKDGIQLNDIYMNSIKKHTIKNNADNIINPIRDESFFQMVNDGDNPCDLKEDIKYINYIDTCNLYLEMGKNDRNN